MNPYADTPYWSRYHLWCRWHFWVCREPKGYDHWRDGKLPRPRWIFGFTGRRHALIYTRARGFYVKTVR